MRFDFALKAARRVSSNLYRTTITFILTSKSNMVTAASHFFYGTFVTLPSLLIASVAHEKLYPTLLALDLISLRITRGTLATTSATKAVSQVAREVWYLVRVELKNAEWIEAEADLVISILPHLDLSLHHYCSEHCAGMALANLKWADMDVLVSDGDISVFELMLQPFDHLPGEIMTVSSIPQLKVGLGLLLNYSCPNPWL